MVVFLCNCVGWNVICVDCMWMPSVTVSHGGDSECSGIVGDWCLSEQTRTPGGNALTPTLGIAAPFEWPLLNLKQSSCNIYIHMLCLRWCCHPPLQTQARGVFSSLGSVPVSRWVHELVTMWKELEGWCPPGRRRLTGRGGLCRQGFGGIGRGLKGAWGQQWEAGK